MYDSSQIREDRVTTEAQRAAIQEAIREHTQRETVNSQTARESLIREGIYNRSGELREDYSGRPANQERSRGR